MAKKGPTYTKSPLPTSTLALSHSRRPLHLAFIPLFVPVITLLESNTLLYPNARLQRYPSNYTVDVERSKRVEAIQSSFGIYCVCPTVVRLSSKTPRSSIQILRREIQSRRQRVCWHYLILANVQEFEEKRFFLPKTTTKLSFTSSTSSTTYTTEMYKHTFRWSVPPRMSRFAPSSGSCAVSRTPTPLQLLDVVFLFLRRFLCGILLHDHASQGRRIQRHHWNHSESHRL